MRYAARRDVNDGPLIKLWREIVGLKRDVREGPFDYWIVIKTSRGLGFWTALEIKDPKREGYASEYTRKQKRLLEFIELNDLPFITWRTEADVYKTAKARIAA